MSNSLLTEQERARDHRKAAHKRWLLGGKDSVFYALVQRLEQGKISHQDLLTAVERECHACQLSLLQSRQNPDGIFTVSSGTHLGIIPLPWWNTVEGALAQILKAIQESTEYEEANNEELMLLAEEMPFVIKARASNLYGNSNGMRLSICYDQKPSCTRYIEWQRQKEDATDSELQGVLVRVKANWIWRDWATEAHRLVYPELHAKKEACESK